MLPIIYFMRRGNKYERWTIWRYMIVCIAVATNEIELQGTGTSVGIGTLLSLY